jgi:serine/threonine-protein kinase
VGDVVSTVPAAGALVRGGDGIELITSTGVCMVLVPNVVGFDSNTANSSMTASHLVAAFSDAVIGTCQPTQAPGTVFSQTPLGGTMAPYGSTVDLTVCPGPLSY